MVLFTSYCHWGVGLPIEEEDLGKHQKQLVYQHICVILSMINTNESYGNQCSILGVWNWNHLTTSVLEGDHCEALCGIFIESFGKISGTQIEIFKWNNQTCQSWLDLTIMTVGIIMEWEFRTQPWSSDFAIFGCQRSEVNKLQWQVKFMVPLQVCRCGYCCYCRKTVFRASEQVRCEFSQKQLSTLQQV
jgi:hypothetical protein